MDKLTLMDGMLLTYFMLCGGFVAGMVGRMMVRLIILVFFCSRKKIEDAAWTLFNLAEMKHGVLKGDQTYTIQGADYEIVVKRRKKLASAAVKSPESPVTQ